MCLHISSRGALRAPAALAASPLFCTSSRSLLNSVMQGGISPPPGPAPIGDIAGAGMGAGAGIGEAAGAPDPGHGAGADGRGASVGHGSVWAAARHAGSTAIATMRERR